MFLLITYLAIRLLLLWSLLLRRPHFLHARSVLLEVLLQCQQHDGDGKFRANDIRLSSPRRPRAPASGNAQPSLETLHLAHRIHRTFQDRLQGL